MGDKVPATSGVTNPVMTNNTYTNTTVIDATVKVHQLGKSATTNETFYLINPIWQTKPSFNSQIHCKAISLPYIFISACLAAYIWYNKR